MRNMAVAMVILSSVLGCGGQVQNTGEGPSPGPSNASGAYVLSGVTLSDHGAFGRAAMPLAQSLCPNEPIDSWTATVSVDGSGHGLMVLSSPCLIVHVPLEATAMGASSLSALVPTDLLVGSWSGDLAAANQGSGDTCDTAQLIGTRMRSAADATVSVGARASAPALTLSMEFITREAGAAPAAPPADPCAGRD